MENLTRIEAEKELREVNNCLSLYMKKKKALQNFLDNEADNMIDSYSLTTTALALKNDIEFIKIHNRKRTNREIARLMGYSERSIYRFLKEKD